MIRDPLPRVAAVRHVRDHVLWVRFSDGVEGEVDLADGLAGELFAPIRDPATFARATVHHGTVVWPNGADWAPETLYERVLAANGSTSRSTDDAYRVPRDYRERRTSCSSRCEDDDDHRSRLHGSLLRVDSDAWCATVKTSFAPISTMTGLLV